MIINSLLDTDLYKFTMQHFAFSYYPSTQVEYTFRNRNTEIDLRPYISEIKKEIEHLETLHLMDDEIEFLGKTGFFSNAYLDFLRNFSLNPKKEVFIEEGRDNLEIRVKGSWLNTILYEVPVLAIVNEVYFRNTSQLNEEGALAMLKESLSHINSTQGFHFSEFGTRRRYSVEWQRKVLEKIHSSYPENLTGTSNLFYAKELGIKPIGTMAHEFIEFFQGITALQESQKTALSLWIELYRGNLGIALSDTLGIEAFLRDFDLYLAKLYDGLRHDSGDPCSWGDKVVDHYRKLGINPQSKSLVFSDGLTIKKAVEIFEYFQKRIPVSFGIGTHLTNNVPGCKALNIVMKMTKSNGMPVAKISDSPGKGMCDNTTYLAWLKEVFSINEEEKRESIHV